MDVLDVVAVNQDFRSGFWLRTVRVLHEVNLSIQEGSIFGFLGANGAGKTSLIHLITGLRAPTSGSVRIFGRKATDRRSRTRVGYLPERPYFQDHLTGNQFLEYMGRLSGMKWPTIRERIPQVLGSVHLSHAGTRELKKYSKGMLQRLGIAQALLHNPDFLVLDEPMSGLDPLGRKEIRDLILAQAQQGRTIFFSSHVIADVEAICGHVALIKAGRLLGAGPLEEVILAAGEGQGEVVTEIEFRASPDGICGPPLEPPDCGWMELEALPSGWRGRISGSAQSGRAVSTLVQGGWELTALGRPRPSLEKLFEREDRLEGHIDAGPS